MHHRVPGESNGAWAKAQVAYSNELTAVIVHLAAFTGPGHDTREVAKYFAHPRPYSVGARAQQRLENHQEAKR